MSQGLPYSQFVKMMTRLQSSYVRSIRSRTHTNSPSETHNLLVRGSTPCGTLDQGSKSYTRIPETFSNCPETLIGENLV
jgi:hypothetical protein